MYITLAYEDYFITLSEKKLNACPCYKYKVPPVEL